MRVVHAAQRKRKAPHHATQHLGLHAALTPAASMTAIVRLTVVASAAMRVDTGVAGFADKSRTSRAREKAGMT